MSDVVGTPEEAVGLELEPLLVLEPLAAFLDAVGLGAGPIEAAAIGDGHSNVTYLLRRGEEKLVLRRPPRGPLPPSAHDVLREARLLSALGPRGYPVPAVLASCEDEAVIGAPFYVMPFVEGHVLDATLPAQLGTPGRRRGSPRNWSTGSSTCTRSTIEDRLPDLKHRDGVGFCNITKCCTKVCPESITITTTPSSRSKSGWWIASTTQ